MASVRLRKRYRTKYVLWAKRLKVIGYLTYIYILLLTILLRFPRVHYTCVVQSSSLMCNSIERKINLNICILIAN